ncbi:MAG: 50S ribosomal protein L11 methyltransferase [bacterium]|nr:50S ribosomal protein L11 methyltransferase [bacterium]
MPTNYVLITFALPEEQNDLAMGVLSAYPLIGVEEGVDVITACFDQDLWQDEWATQIPADLKEMGITTSVVHQDVIPEQNWNAEWEQSIDPVVVNERITIVPEWRVDEVDAPLKLIITPKMSFGTGHHATTRMMCILVEKYVKRGDAWVDVGTGTGVLAILAAKLGAREVFAFDNNEWSIDNARENIDRNDVTAQIRLEQATLQDMQLPHCDGIAANLYRHLVIPYASAFVSAVRPGGTILVSGILKYDAQEVTEPFLALGCTLLETLTETEWCAIALRVP